MKSRDQLVSLMPPQSICAEIGVKAGDFSKIIMECCDPKELHLIDPWECGHTHEHRSIKQMMWDKMLTKMERWSEADSRVRIHRGLSADILPTFPDNYFDWIYVDGNHTFPYVTEDLTLSGDKVKLNGFVLGHDFDVFAVQRAVVNAMNTGRFLMKYMTWEKPHPHHPSFGLVKVLA
jgi:hypothetical protein